MSLNAIHAAVHSLGPRSHAYGEMSDTSDSYFLVTDFLDLSARPSSGNGSGISLAQKLVKLHSTPAPTPEGFGKPGMLGVHVFRFLPQRVFMVQTDVDEVSIRADVHMSIWVPSADMLRQHCSAEYIQYVVGRILRLASPARNFRVC